MLFCIGIFDICIHGLYVAELCKLNMELWYNSWRREKAKMKKCGNNQKSGISAESTSILETVGKVDIVTKDIDDDFIKSRIFTIRGVQVMLDRDLAMLYGVPAKRVNEQVKRNAERFPDDFMFRLTKEECLRSQIATLNMEHGKHLKYMPYAFTESGVAMLSGVLRSSVAIEVNVRIMRAFVAMRRALASIAPVLSRVSEVERLQLEEKSNRLADQSRNEERFDAIFKAMDSGDFPPQKVFFEGKHYDAYSFAKKLVRKAAKKIVLVDGYCDDVTLDILAQKKGGVVYLETSYISLGDCFAALQIVFIAP